MQNSKTFRPDRIGSYFRMEWLSLALVTASGLIYNVGLLATPWFEGRLAQCLADILGGNETAAQMAVLVLVYIAVTLLCVAASVAASLLPPLLLLGRVIDRLTAGLPLTFLAVLLYFGSLALEGVFSSAQESLLVLFGQKMTHALRSEMSRKLTRLPAGTLAGQNPGQVAARFSGDVDTVEALFTSGIISMVADACRIVSILAVIAVKTQVLRWFCCWCFRCSRSLPAMCRSGCWPPSWTTAAPLPPCPVRCRRRCTTSAPSGRWASRATGSAAMTGASATVMPPWSAPTSMMRSIRRWCCC